MAEKKKKKKKKSAAAPSAGWAWLRCLLPLLLAGAAYLLAHHTAGFAEWYAETVYPHWVDIVGRFFALFSFSAAEILLYAILLYGILSLVGAFIRRKKGGSFFKNGAGHWLRGILKFAGVLALLFMLGGGINYGREPFSQAEGFSTEKSSRDELISLCIKMTEEINSLSGQMVRDANGIMTVPDSLQKDAVKAMEAVGKRYGALDGYYPEPNTLLWNGFLAGQQLSGVFSPFTTEAHFNRTMTPYNRPFTACHELSHLRGFMREDEANFIAFLAATGSEEPYFRYSGYLLGYIYASNALYGEDYDTWLTVRGMLPAGAIADLEENSRYWAQYESKVAEAASKVNDSYLKANGQSDGTKSYGRVVDLMLAYYREQNN